MASKNHIADVIVAGSGPAGMIAALAIARAGAEVILAGPPVNTSDRRTTTLMMPALDFITGLCPLEALMERSAPLKTMRIIDATTRLIRSPAVSFHACETGLEQFGYNIPNADLNLTLSDAVGSTGNITTIEGLIDGWQLGRDRVVAGLASGQTIEAELAVAADGRNSRARQAAGIDYRDIPYPQSALVVSFSHARPHEFISTEFHTESGPFTQVPLPGKRSSLVWVLPPQTAESYLEMDDAELARLIEAKMQSMLGAVTMEQGRQIYPMSTRIPYRFACNRVALAGEAAHVFPPIGAQGLNLGVRDAIDLETCIGTAAGDRGAAAVLENYNNRRWPDITGRAGSVHLLNRSLLSSMLPAQIVRAAGLGALGSIPPLRAFAMREGMQPGSGLRALISGLRVQVGR